MQLNYHRAGTGPPLVLIHGIGSQWQVWKPVLDRLKRALDSAQQEEFEKDWDECLDAVKQAGLRKR